MNSQHSAEILVGFWLGSGLVLVGFGGILGFCLGSGGIVDGFFWFGFGWTLVDSGWV